MKDNVEPVTLDARKNVLLFDGCRAHAVEPFKGERYSMVFFTSGSWDNASTDDIQALEEAGFDFPDADSLAGIKSCLSPP